MLKVFSRFTMASAAVFLPVANAGNECCFKKDMEKQLQKGDLLRDARKRVQKCKLELKEWTGGLDLPYLADNADALKEEIAKYEEPEGGSGLVLGQVCSGPCGANYYDELIENKKDFVRCTVCNSFRTCKFNPEESTGYSCNGYAKLQENGKCLNKQCNASIERMEITPWRTLRTQKDRLKEIQGNPARVKRQHQFRKMKISGQQQFKDAIKAEYRKLSGTVSDSSESD